MNKPDKTHEPTSGQSISGHAAIQPEADHVTGHRAETGRRHGWARRLAGLAAVAVLGLGLSACGHGWQRGWSDDEGEGQARIEKAVDRIFSKVDATDEQKARIATIAEQTLAEMRPFRAEMRDSRSRAIDLLTAAELDTDRIEALRKEQAARADAALTIATAGLVEIAGVLTPEQRAQARDKIAERKSGWHRW